MFDSISMTGTGIAVFIIAYALKYFGVDLGNDTITLVVNDVLFVAGTVWTIYGQIRRTDLKAGFIRKA